MKKLILFLASAAFGLGVVAAQETKYSDLIISEYVEGSGNNKAIEIFNGTGADVDLSAYTLQKETNGDPSKLNEIKLSGTLKDGAVYVIVSTSASDELKELGDKIENTITAFNGNDAIVLLKGTTRIDEVGVFGQTTDWGKDVTLRRKCDNGPTVPYDVEEWEQLGIDDFSGLGSHCGIDLTVPKIQKVLTDNEIPTSLKVYFSKELDTVSAKTAANYSIDNGLTVSAASVSADRTVVELTTSAMTSGTTYTLTVNGVKDLAGNTVENATITFSFGYEEVADLAALCALRETYAEGQKYKVAGEVVITAIIGKFGSNQNTTNVWVQDKGCETSTGHSMMLYYMDDALPAGAKIGDVMTGLIGELTVYNDLIEMQYIDTTSLVLTGETADITIDKVTISDLKSSKKLDYQNAMVCIENVSFVDEGKFAENKSYKITDDNATIDFRTNREGSYLDQKIPVGKVNVIGYIGYYNGNCQISPRMYEDIVTNVANDAASTVSYRVYPNPVSGSLNVELPEGGNFGLSVYSLSGALMLNENGLNSSARIDLSSLAKGIYLLEIRTDNGTARTKVIVK